MLFRDKLPHKLLFEPDALPAVGVEPLPADWPAALAAEGRDALALAVTEEQVLQEEGRGGAAKLDHGCFQALPAEAQAVLVRSLQLQDFKGKKGQATQPIVVQAAPGGSPVSLLVLGLGPAKALEAAGWGQSPYHAAGAALGAAAKAHGLASVAVALPAGAEAAAAEAAAAAASFVCAAAAALYEGGVRYKSKSEYKAKLHSITLLLKGGEAGAPAISGGGGEALGAAAARGLALARGTLMARYLVEAPANVCTPRHLADAARHLASLHPERLTAQVLERDQVRELGMGLFLGVAHGSDEPLRLVHLTYHPPGAVTRKVALVGKGLTFDSGGYNLKVSGGIEAMKCDMGGAGAVLGAARAIADLKPAGVQVHFITAACENMVSGSATRPSDIHTAANGKTVEVVDTDAEGRLTLADALWYAQEKAGATTVVDVATLTGAAAVALGGDTGALFANSDGLAASLDGAARRAGEKLWRMPLNECMVKKLESPIADLKNHCGRAGGAITAALFLREFVNEGVEWAHLDIAGPAWDDAASLPTGFGAATLAEMVLQLAAALAPGAPQ